MAAALTPQQRKIVSLAALGGMLEFYDFIIYGIFSLYFAHQFFPHQNHLMTILQSYLVFVLGYLARPIGGLIFSHIGDEYGRKKVLIVTIVLMGLASLGIGILPTYAQMGMAAPLLLVLLRLVQGLALGGELPSTYVYIHETIAQNRGLGFGITMSGVNAGLLLGMIINFCLIHFFTSQQLESFGWRLPFILGGLLCIISYKIRKTLQETTAFQKIHNKPKLPVIYLLRHHWEAFFSGIAIVAIMAGTVVAAIIFMPTYLHEILKVNQNSSYDMVVLMVMNVTAIYLTGRVAQHYPPVMLFKKLLLIACIGVPLAYYSLHQNYIVLGLGLLGGIEGMAAMITPYLLTTLFESKISLTGVALCYNVGFTVFGGLGPVIITHFINAGYDPYLTPCAYLLIVTVISGLGLLALAFLRSEEISYPEPT